jgi:hypothetical protein
MVLMNVAGDTGRGSRRSFGALGQHVPPLCQKHRLTHKGISLHVPAAQCPAILLSVILSHAVADPFPRRSTSLT